MNELIKKYRIQNGFTQEQLAEKANCSRQYINSIENGTQKSISTKLLLKIAEALNVKVELLLCDKV